MIPDTGARATAPFPYVGLAAVVLLLHAILVAVVPANPYRAAFSFAALFAVGYCTLALIVGDSIRLTSPEILAFSTGLTIFITSLSALGVSVLGIPITVFAVVIVGLPIAVLASFARRSGGGSLAAITAFSRGLFDFAGYSRLEKGIVAALLGGITAALIVFVALALVHFPGDLSPGLAIYGPDNTAGSLPTHFVQGQPQDIGVSALGGSTAGAFVVRIRLVPVNATGNESFHTVFLANPLRLDPFSECNVSLVLGAGESWNQFFSISIEQPGTFNLGFALLDSSSTVVANSGLRVVVT
ncbi:MAG TPA: hypothetical protein VNP71_09025 [Thermoplasmata archaeon]|nr:hypothetical protein [Thermoplasmata archaeon]